MIIGKFKKVIMGTLAIMSVFALTPMAAHAEWKQDNVGWWYTYSPTSSSYYRNDWLIENGKWYYFNDAGYSVKGWKEIAGLWYYFNTDGSMAKDTYVGNYYVNHNGVWKQDNNKVSTASQGISVTYPLNWTKISETNGCTTYNLSNKEANVVVSSINMQSYSEQEFFEINLAELKSEINKELKLEKNPEYKVSNQIINGKTANVIDFTYSSDGKTLALHIVYLYNNNNAYMFMIIQPDSISSSNLDSFNRLLDTIKFN